MLKTEKNEKTRVQSIAKSDLLEQWVKIEPDQVLEPRFIANDHTGSTIDEDGIRITGTLEFVEQVLSHLKEMIAFEGPNTRLTLSCSEVVDKNTQYPLGTFRAVIQVVERGDRMQGLGPRNYKEFNKSKRTGYGKTR